MDFPDQKAGIRSRTTGRAPVRRHDAVVLAGVLALILSLTVMVAAVQVLVVRQLAAAKQRGNRERALELAEIGANAYLFQLGTAFLRAPLSWMPRFNDVSSAPEPWPVDFATFRKRAGRHSNFPVVRYPSGAKRQGFVVGHWNVPGGVVVVSYGFCNGSTRMVRCAARSFSPFEWAAAYGLDPHTSGEPGPGGDTGPAWSFTGNATIVGASGSEGLIDNAPNAAWFDGPLYLVGRGDSLNPDLSPDVWESGPGLPPGHVGTGTVAFPFVRRSKRSYAVPTVDELSIQYANLRFGQVNTVGVRWFAGVFADGSYRHHDTTGIRYVVRNKREGDPHFGKLRQLPVPMAFPSLHNPVLDLGEVPAATLTQSGMTDDEEFVGVRMYPGNYFFTQIRQPSSQGATLYLRSYADGGSGTGMDGNPMVVYDDVDYSHVATNPNPGFGSDKEIRIWVGDRSSGTNVASQLSNNVWMEDRTFPSRFRILVGNRAGCTIDGDSQRKFTVNLLANARYTPTSGPYAGIAIRAGRVSIRSNVYLLGSLVAWNVQMGGGATIERQAQMEPSPYEYTGYQVTDWREIQ